MQRRRTARPNAQTPVIHGVDPKIFRQAQDFASFLALQITQPYSRVADIADDYAPEAWVTHRHTDDHC